MYYAVSRFYVFQRHLVESHAAERRAVTESNSSRSTTLKLHSIANRHCRFLCQWSNANSNSIVKRRTESARNNRNFVSNLPDPFSALQMCIWLILSSLNLHSPRITVHPKPQRPMSSRILRGIDRLCSVVSQPVARIDITPPILISDGNNGRNIGENEK